MHLKELQARMLRLERQLRATCYRFNIAKSAASRARLLRRCRAIGDAMIETFNEDYYS
jgi:hypothetical protein